MHDGIKTDAFALLDSGAKGNYANMSLIKKLQIPVHDLNCPVYPQNVDGTFNQQGVIRHAAILQMEMANKH